MTPNEFVGMVAELTKWKETKFADSQECIDTLDRLIDEAREIRGPALDADGRAAPETSEAPREG